MPIPANIMVSCSKQTTGGRMASTFPAEVSARRLTVDKGRFIHAIIRDISERKRTEQALISAKERAEEAGVFQRVLLENMSHELRTPMQGILGFARLLASGSRDDPAA